MKQFFTGLGFVVLFLFGLYHSAPELIHRVFSDLSSEERNLVYKAFPDFDTKEIKYLLEFSAAEADAAADSLTKANPNASDDEVGLDTAIARIRACLSVPYSKLPASDQAFLRERDSVLMGFMTELSQLRSAVKCGEVPSYAIESATEDITANFQARMSLVEAKHPDAAQKFGIARQQRAGHKLAAAYGDVLKKRARKYKEKHPDMSEDEKLIQICRLTAELWRDLAKVL